MTKFRTINTVDFMMMRIPDHRVTERPLINAPLQRAVRRAPATPNALANLPETVNTVPTSPILNHAPLQQVVNETSSSGEAAVRKNSIGTFDGAGSQRSFPVVRLLVVVSVMAGLARVLIPTLANARMKIRSESPKWTGNTATQRGFSLIELLVVIGIIAILAGILLPVLSKIKENAKIKVAKMEMSHLAIAIHQYETEYSRFPMSKEALAAGNPDFTFGTASLPNYPAIGNTAGGYQTNNSQLLAILRPNNIPALAPLFTIFNPRQLALLDAKNASVANGPGVGADGVYRDPWGNPYIVTIDLNEDNLCHDGFYSSFGVVVPGEVMIWSFGPDGATDSKPATGPKGGANKDNVLSWE